MTQENFFSNTFSNTYSFIVSGTASILDTLKNSITSLAEIQFLESRYDIRISNITSLIEIQQSQVAFLEKNEKTNGVISEEIERINTNLEKLMIQRDALQKELNKLKELEGDFTPAIDQNPLNALKSELKVMVASNSLENAIEKLMECLEKECKTQDELILFSSRLKSIDKQRALGLISIVEHGNLHNNLVHGFLHVINEIQEKDLKR